MFEQQVQQQQIVVNRQANMSGYISPLGSPQPIMSPNPNHMQQIPTQQQQQVQQQQQLQRRQQNVMQVRCQYEIHQENNIQNLQKRVSISFWLRI